MSSLHDLGILYGTDKATDHRYCDFYDFHLSSIRYENLKVLEIGIYEGASLRMWRDYFQNSKVFGVDSLEAYKAKLISEDRIFSFKVDQGDPNHLKKFNDTYGPFDIVIDDGSHMVNHQWISFFIFNGVRLFIWEDLHTSRMTAYSGLRNDRGEMPLDFAKRLSLEKDNCFLFDRDTDEKHVTFIVKGEVDLK